MMLASLYTSVASTILCALVANYSTLLASRILIGITAGLNMSPSGVFLTEKASHKKVRTYGAYSLSIGVSLGSAWVSLLAYFLLDLLSWRIFVILSSLPVFVPAYIFVAFGGFPDVQYCAQ